MDRDYLAFSQSDSNIGPGKLRNKTGGEGRGEVGVGELQTSEKNVCGSERNVCRGGGW